MKLLFVNPLDRAVDVPRDVPTEILSLATVADKLGHKVDIFDLNAYRESNTVQGIKEVIKEDKWDLVWLSASFTQLKDAFDAIAQVRPLQETAVIVLGGKAATLMPDEVMQMCPDLDIVVIGDQEDTLVDVLEQLSGQKWDGIKGIDYRQEGKIHKNALRPAVNLDQLPLLNYSFIPLQRYFQASPLPFSMEAMQAKRRLSFSWIREHRGSDGSRTVRFPSTARVVESLVAARFKYAIDFAYLIDRDITVNPNWFADFLNRYMDESLHEVVNWGCAMDLKIVATRPELVRTMKEAGCKFIQLSLNEANDEILWQVAVDSIKRQGVAIAAEMTYGDPSETISSLAKRAYFVFRNSMNVAVRPLVPYPDTPYFWKNTEKIKACYPDSPDPLKAFLTDVSPAKAANVSKFDRVDLLGYGVLLSAKDYVAILETTHERGIPHDPKLDEICPVHKRSIVAK